MQTPFLFYRKLDLFSTTTAQALAIGGLRAFFWQLFLFTALLLPIAQTLTDLHAAEPTSPKTAPKVKIATIKPAKKPSVPALSEQEEATNEQTLIPEAIQEKAKEQTPTPAIPKEQAPTSLADLESAKELPVNPLSLQDVVKEIVKQAAGYPNVTDEQKKINDDIKKNIRPYVQSAQEKLKKLEERAIVDELCNKIGSKLGSVSKQGCRDENLTLTSGRSVNGLPIVLKEYLPRKNRTPQARILLLGGIHGDEYSSISVIFKWMQILNKHHIGLFHWRIVPLVNPDGLLRKESQRMNANNVDLNRNFPTATTNREWLKESQEYWVGETCRDPRRYPGPSPLSEPESQWVADEIQRFKPNAVVSVHAPFGLLDFDGPPTTPPERLGQLYLSLLGTYPGSLGRYAGTIRKVPIITIELKYAGIMPPKHEVNSIWMDLVRWLVGHVKDRRSPNKLFSDEEHESVNPTPYPETNLKRTNHD